MLGALAKDAETIPRQQSRISPARGEARVPDSLDAYLGLGTALVDSQRFSEAKIPPLEKYEKMAPDTPTGHYELALAYAGVGRKEDANRDSKSAARSRRKPRSRKTQSSLRPGAATSVQANRQILQQTAPK